MVYAFHVAFSDEAVDFRAYSGLSSQWKPTSFLLCGLKFGFEARADDVVVELAGAAEKFRVLFGGPSSTSVVEGRCSNITNRYERNRLTWRWRVGWW